MHLSRMHTLRNSSHLYLWAGGMGPHLPQDDTPREQASPRADPPESRIPQTRPPGVPIPPNQAAPPWEHTPLWTDTDL